MHKSSNVAEQIAGIARILQAKRLRLACAESCTGGWIAKLCTDQAGSSEWFDHGVVCYSTDSKKRLLAVPETTLKRYGVVSEEVAAAMVRGLLDEGTSAQVALSVTGIAGPGGGSSETPVGTVCFGWMADGGELLTECKRFTGDREAVRWHSVSHALAGVEAVLRAGCDTLWQGDKGP